MRSRALAPALLVLLSPLAEAAQKPPSTPIRLHVDAREAPRKILHARLVMTVEPGPLTLYYPKWIPGEHSPSGPIVNLVGLRLTAGGNPIAWRRDPSEMFAFRCDVPRGTTALEAELDFLLPSGGNFTAGRSASEKLAVLAWNTVLLHPPGQPSDAIQYAASLRLPAGWSQATALPVTSRDGDTVSFDVASLTRLVDSPVLMGAHMRTFPAGDARTHQIAAAADSAAALEMPAAWQPSYGRLVDEALALFGARHYTSYRWLLALSDHVAHFGLEHHESSDNRLPERTFADEKGRRSLAGLLSHEYVHSWNGKFRRPAEIATTDLQQPMKTSLLWVYEGLTQYLGVVLDARSGLWSDAEFREYVAAAASALDHRPGRSWRPLVDTAAAAQVLYGAPAEWASWRREVDFYDESILIWLEADAIIREKSSGQRSLDDFCRRFHGGAEGPYVVKPYSFDELVTTLTAVESHDWKGFLNARVEATGPRAPLGGILSSGWRLSYGEEPNVFLKDYEEQGKTANEIASIGAVVKEDGTLRDVVPAMAAAQAGLAPGMKVLAVNGRRYSHEVLRDALAATKSGAPLELIAENDEYVRMFSLGYKQGKRYPHLVRDDGRPDVLAKILAPRAKRE